MKQGDALSPKLFTLYINDVIVEIKQAGIGVRLPDLTAGMFLYAGDVVRPADT